MARAFPQFLAPYFLSILRFAAAFLFIPHGTRKHFGAPTVEPANRAEILSLSGIAGVLEIAGGVLLLFGLFTRPVAFILSGLMAFAYFLRHAPDHFWPILNRGELAALYCFVFLYIAAAGGGPWCLDALRGRRRAPRF